jgi:antitoxin YefM
VLGRSGTLAAGSGRWLTIASVALERFHRLLFWSMTTVPLSEAKARLSEIADEVGRTHERVHITRNGRDYVVLISAEDLESIEATLELLADQPAQERVRRAEDEATRGDVLDEHDVRGLLAQRRQPE